MTWMYVKKEENGAYYPRIGLVSTGEGMVFGVPRWQSKKWKLADEELADFDIGSSFYTIEKEKVSIPWKEWKTLEERFEKVVYVVLWMFHGTENEKDADAVADAVTTLTHNEKFEVIVDENGNAHLRCPREDDDDLGAFESFEHKMANDSEAVKDYLFLTKGEPVSSATDDVLNDECNDDDVKDEVSELCDRIEAVIDALNFMGNAGHRRF